MSESFLSRQISLIGEEATARLAGMSVMIFGVGGVGGYVVEALTRAGIGRLILVDHDTVSVSNRNRQIIALCSTLGARKTDAFSARIKDINPDCRVEEVPIFATPENIDQLIGGASPDWIVDAIDYVPGKIAIALAAARRGIPMIASMGTGNKLAPERLRVSDLGQTSVCPLARAMRREMKKHSVMHMQVLWSDEIPCRSPEADPRVPASISFVPSSAGLLIASHLIRAELVGERGKYTVS